MYNLAIVFIFTTAMIWQLDVAKHHAVMICHVNVNLELGKRYIKPSSYVTPFCEEEPPPWYVFKPYKMRTILFNSFEIKWMKCHLILINSSDNSSN